MGLFAGVWEIFIAVYEPTAKLKEEGCEIVAARHLRVAGKASKSKGL
jgi:hypothetical protein